jgi:hypothetical protein
MEEKQGHIQESGIIFCKMQHISPRKKSLCLQVIDCGLLIIKHSNLAKSVLLEMTVTSNFCSSSNIL